MKIRCIVALLVMASLVMLPSCGEVEHCPDFAVVYGDEKITPLEYWDVLHYINGQLCYCEDHRSAYYWENWYDYYYEWWEIPFDIAAVPRLAVEDVQKIAFESKRGAVVFCNVYRFNELVGSLECYYEYWNVHDLDVLDAGAWYVEFRVQYLYGLRQIGFDMGECYEHRYMLAIEVK